MKAKMAILIHKYDNSILIVKRQADLSTVLGVSLSTVRRNYSIAGHYESDIYNIYIDPEIYDSGVEYKYKRDVAPPTPKMYSGTKRTDKPDYDVNMNASDGFSAHNKPLHDTVPYQKRTETPNNKFIMTLSDGLLAHKPLFDDEVIEQDWKEYETNMPLSEYDNYYSKRTLEQLKESAKYFALKPYHMKYINKYGQLRELD